MDHAHEDISPYTYKMKIPATIKLPLSINLPTNYK